MHPKLLLCSYMKAKIRRFPSAAHAAQQGQCCQGSSSLSCNPDCVDEGMQEQDVQQLHTFSVWRRTLFSSAA